MEKWKLGDYNVNMMQFVEVDQLGTRNESSAESSIIYTHTQYLHLAKLVAWIDILFYKQQG